MEDFGFFSLKEDFASLASYRTVLTDQPGEDIYKHLFAFIHAYVLKPL